VLYWDVRETAFVVKFLTYPSTERNRNYRHSLLEVIYEYLMKYVWFTA